MTHLAKERGDHRQEIAGPDVLDVIVEKNRPGLIKRARTWIEYLIGDVPSKWRFPGLDRIQFADSRHGWLKADTALYYTEDGGRKWTQFN